MTETRAKAIKLYWNIAKERCPFHKEEMVNSFLEGFIDCAEYLLLQIAELEAQNKWLEGCNSELAEHLGKANDRITELEKENAQLKDKLNNLSSVAEVRLANWQKYEKGLKEAKDLIRNLLRVTYGEGWNYSLDEKVKAEDFLKEDKK